jgi:hypothetical protein
MPACLERPWGCHRSEREVGLGSYIVNAQGVRNDSEPGEVAP